MSKSQIDPPAYSPTQSTTTSSTLQSQLTSSRTQHIAHTIPVSILPLLQHRVQQGLSRTTIALLSANIPSPPPPTSWGASDIKSENQSDDFSTRLPKVIEVIEVISSHFDDNEDNTDIQRVQLNNSIDTTAFWSQPAVLEELSRTLEDLLHAQHAPISTFSPSQHTSSALPQPELSQKPKSRGIFFRLSSSEKKKLVPDSVTQATSNVYRRERHSISVHVENEEVCLRTLTEFGLYETVTRRAVLIKVRIE